MFLAQPETKVRPAKARTLQLKETAEAREEVCLFLAPAQGVALQITQIDLAQPISGNAASTQNSFSHMLIPFKLQGCNLKG